MQLKFFLVGGFLGSGKTTAIKNACTVLRSSNSKVAVITNDQGHELVDTAFIKRSGIPVEEVTAGCFCCNYNQLTASITSLLNENQPDVIFAESVGSCTDLVATVVKPLAMFYPDTKVLISVFADAVLLFSLLTNTASFLNDNIRYIYKKQVEEADILVINKIDLLNADDLQVIKQVMESEYPTKKILYQNSFELQNVQQWLQTMNAFSVNQPRQSLELDYQRYATGEAALAWLDAVLEISTLNKTAGEVARKLMNQIEKEIRRQYVIGHLKFLVDAGESIEKFSYTAIENPQTNSPILFKQRKKVSLLINARVQAAPTEVNEIIARVINRIAAQTGSQIRILKVSSFPPGYPTPTYRMGN